MPKPKVIFMGSPAAVIPPLEGLLALASQDLLELVAVVSQPAKPTGRKRKLQDPALAEFAKNKGLLTLQPARARDPEFLERLTALAPDIIITAAYGQILTEAFLAIPRRATINLHPSLLPRYRGATPVQTALLHGDELTGLTVLFTVKELDAGNIIVQQPTPVPPRLTASELLVRLFAEYNHLWPEVFAKLADPDFTGTPQEPSQISHCYRIQKEAGCIDWQQPATAIYAKFRAFTDWPGVYTYLGQKRVLIMSMTLGDRSSPKLSPGEFCLDKARRALRVGCGQGSLQIHELKPAGGKKTDAIAFWNGHQCQSKDSKQFLTELGRSP